MLSIQTIPVRKQFALRVETHTPRLIIDSRPVFPVTVEGDGSFKQSAAIVHRRGFVGRDYTDVYLDRRRERLLLTLKPARGELYRHPTKYEAQVFDDRLMRIERVVISALADLVVVP